MGVFFFCSTILHSMVRCPTGRACLWKDIPYPDPSFCPHWLSVRSVRGGFLYFLASGLHELISGVRWDLTLSKLLLDCPHRHRVDGGSFFWHWVCIIKQVMWTWVSPWATISYCPHRPSLTGSVNGGFLFHPSMLLTFRYIYAQNGRLCDNSWPLSAQ